MVKTRRQNAKADANTSKRVFSKELNDLKTKQGKEYSVPPAGQYHLNLFVLGLKYSSTEAEIKKAYHPVACRFHPNKNIGLDTTEMIKMITRIRMNWNTNCVLMMQVGKKNVSKQQKMRFQYHLITILI